LHREEDGAVLGRIAQVAHRFGHEILADPQFGRRRRRGRDAPAGRQAQQGHEQAAARDQLDPPGPLGHQQGAHHLAQQDAHEGPHLDHAVAADQFLRLQVLRQVGVLHRAEQSRVHAHADHRRDQQPQGVGQPADRGDRHDRDFQQLDEARQPALFDPVGDLAGGGGEDHVGQDEQARDQVVQQAGRERGPGQGVIGQRDHQRGLEQVVVEGAQELGPEERRKAALGQQGKLARLAHF